MVIAGFALHVLPASGADFSQQNVAPLPGYTSSFFVKPLPLSNAPSAGTWYEAGNKSMTKAVILSLIVPGAGEIYTGRLVRGLVFLGIDALGWTAYTVYNRKGDNIDAEFKRYLNTHWDAAAYRSYLADYMASHNGQPPDSFTHTLPDTKDQQYYEMIGKYDQFVRWWDDYNPNTGPVGQSQNRLYYMGRRYASNRNYDRAMIVGMVIFVNRIASLIDTIYLVKKNNKFRAQHWSWDVYTVPQYGYSTGYFSLRYHW